MKKTMFKSNSNITKLSVNFTTGMSKIKCSILRGCLFFVLLFAFNQVNAQKKAKISIPGIFLKRTHISIGAGDYQYPYNTKMENVFAGNFATQTDLFFRYSDFCISLNTQFAAGYHIKMYQDSLRGFSGDVPLILQANIGHLSSKDFYSYFGGFAGGGIDWLSHNGWRYKTPLVTIGLRSWLFGQSFTIRYMHYYLNYFELKMMNSITLDLNIGKYLSSVKANNQISNFMKPYRK